MKIIILGTSASVPTAKRNETGVLVSYRNENILFDCGENIQRQLRIAKVPITKITKILITHWHGDHVLGLPGLLQSLALNNYSKTLEIYGPKGSKKAFQNISKVYVYQGKIDVKVREIKEGLVFKNDFFKIETKKLKHSTICYGYSIKEKDKRKINLTYTKKFGLTRHPLLGDLQKGKNIIFRGKKITVAKATTLKQGKKVAFVTDTIVTKNSINLARNSDLLIIEATFAEKDKDKALETYHLTARQAAYVAKKANVKKAALIHFSQRYKDEKVLEKEARKVFKNTVAAKDLQVFEL